MPNKIEDIFNELRDYLLKARDGEDMKRSPFVNFKTKLNNLLKYETEDNQKKIREMYKYEIEFLEGITAHNAKRPSIFLSENMALLGKVLNGKEKNLELNQIEAESVDEIIESDNNETITITSPFKKDEIIEANLEELEKLNVECENIRKKVIQFSTEYEVRAGTDYKNRSDVIIQDLESLKERIDKVAYFFHNAADKKRFLKNFQENEELTNKFNFLNDKMFESRELLYKTKVYLLNMDSIQIDIECDLDKIEGVIEAEKKTEKLIPEFEQCKKVFEQRLKYYSENKELDYTSRITEFDKLIKYCDLANERLDNIKQIKKELLGLVNKDENELENEGIAEEIFENDTEFEVYRKLSDEEYRIQSIINEEINYKPEIQIEDEESWNHLFEEAKKNNELIAKQNYAMDLDENDELDLEELEEKIIKNTEEELKNSIVEKKYEKFLEKFDEKDPQEYLDDKSKVLINKNGKFDSRQKACLRGLFKKIYADSKKFKGDTFFEETYKLGTFSKKPKLFTGKISSKNAYILNELIIKFEACKGELTEKEIENFTEFVLNPILANKKLGKLQMISYEPNKKENVEMADERDNNMISNIKDMVKENVTPESEEYMRKKTVIERERH